MLSSSRKHTPALRRALAPRHRQASALALLMGGLFSGPAAAALSDTIHPFASVTYSHEDNLLRLSDDVALPPGQQRDDNLRSAVAGVQLERPIGRQVLTGQAKVSRVTFSHYDQLNYNGQDFNAALQWHLFEHLDGHLGGSYSQTLTPFTDFHSSERNLRTQRGEYVDGAWRFHPSWQVRGGFTRNKFAYDLLSQQYNDRTEDLSEIGVDYLSSTSSRIGLVSRELRGRYPNQRSIGSIAIDDGYKQHEIKLNIFWYLGETTQVQVLAGRAKREHRFYTVRDTSGVNGRVTANWNPTGKLRFSAAAWREFSAVESSIVSSSLNKGASLNAIWNTSAKIAVNGALRRDKRDFSAAGGIALPLDLTDTIRTTSVGLTYNPVRVLQFGLNAFRENRSGSPFIGSGTYKANGMSLTATAQF
jgi:exopolysaccharide biosynthesis operon protein EpsL